MGAKAFSTREGGACLTGNDLAMLSRDGARIRHRAQGCAFVCYSDSDECTEEFRQYWSVDKDQLTSQLMDATRLSEPCAACFADTILCAAERCAQVCAPDSASDDCLWCLDDHCERDFQSCSGVVLPTFDSARHAASETLGAWAQDSHPLLDFSEPL